MTIFIFKKSNYKTFPHIEYDKPVYLRKEKVICGSINLYWFYMIMGIGDLAYDEAPYPSITV